MMSEFPRFFISVSGVSCVDVRRLAFPDVHVVLCCAYLFHCLWLFVTPWTATRQAPLSMGILQARILEWVAMPSFRGSSQPQPPALQVDSLPSEPPGKPKNTEWVAYPFSRRTSQPRNLSGVSCIAGGFFARWATRKDPYRTIYLSNHFKSPN